MRVANLGLAALLLCTSSPCFAAPKPLLRTYLAMAFGVDALTADVGGQVLNDRFLGQGELGIGYQLTDKLLLEGTYGWLGRHQQPPPIRPITFEEQQLPASERAFRVTINPMILRLRYARGGQRNEYAKPEFSLGLGFYQVTRLLRNLPSLPFDETSRLLPAGELGAAALFVFSRNFMGTVGARYVVTKRESIVGDTDFLDGASVLLAFRIFLPSPRDVQEP